MKQQGRKRIGEILCELGLINKAQLDKALAWQKEEYRLVGQILLDMGCITADQLYSALEVQECQVR